MLKVYADSDNANEDAMMMIEAMNGHEDDRTVEVVACKGGWAIMIGGECVQEEVELSITEEAAIVARAENLNPAATARLMKIARKLEAKLGK